MTPYMLRNRRPRHSSLLALAAVFAVGCSSPEPGATDEVEPTVENATDYPSVPVSEACGGKCDGPDAILNASPQRVVGELTMTEYESAENEIEFFKLVAPVLEDRAELVEDGHTLNAKVYAADGAADPDFFIEAELVFNGDQYETPDYVDTTELLPWQLLRIDLTGVAGEQEINQRFEFAPGSVSGVEVLPDLDDPFALASDPTVPVIYLDSDTPAPEYERASVEGFSLGGTEFWQRWPDGLNPTFNYGAGTVLGQKCMYASARRFEAIMSDPPESIVRLREESDWGGSFFNWNDDFSHETATRRPTGAVLWAWKTHLIKFISQTGADGACFLPTVDMMERAAESCLATAEAEDGAIEGCQAY